jgi:hypothetical protein
MGDSILKKVLKNLGQIVVETGKESVLETGKITESIITGKELLGDVKTLSGEEYSKKQAEDQKEISDLRSQISGRNVEGEIKQIVKEKEQEEDEQEKQMLQQIKAQREAEERERMQLESQMGLSSNPNKQKKSRGSAFVKGKRKTQQPDPTTMSQTSEKGGKME